MKTIPIILAVSLLIIVNFQFLQFYSNLPLNLNENSTSLLIGYSGNSEDLIHYLNSFKLNYYELGQYFLISGSNGEIISEMSSKIPYYIANKIFFSKQGLKVIPALSNSNDPYTISDIISAYGIPLIGSWGKNFTGVVLVPYGDPNLFQNLNNFDSKFNIKKGNISVQYFPSPPRTFPSGWIEETDLDVEVMHAVAPDASIIVFVTKDDNSTTLEMALNYIIENHLGDVVSMSWGGPEVQVYDPFFHSTIFKAAENGITLVAATGDSDIVEYPASDPYVLSVGGTSLYLNNGKYYFESIWSSSGGGNSTIFKKPIWQQGDGLYSLSGRGVPDLSIDADPSTGVYIYSGGLVGMGGTSLSAPLLSGIILDLDSKIGYPLGFFTPQLYYMYENSHMKYFHSIFLGHGFSSVWEPQIGLGSPIVNNWTFQKLKFYTGVFLGNYSNVNSFGFKVRGIDKIPYHNDDVFSFTVNISGEYNISIGYMIPEKMFYYSYDNERIFLTPVQNNTLYSLKIYTTNSTIKINGLYFRIPRIPSNFSLYSFAIVKSGEGFYTNLGPVEFRDFYIEIQNKNYYPSKILAIKGNGCYGAFELPFIYNDFVIGDVGNFSEDILWPRNFSYLSMNSLEVNETSIGTLPFVVGAGTTEDPYIITGIMVKGTVGISIDLKGSILLNNIIVNAFYGIISEEGNIITVKNSKITSIMGLQFVNSKIYIYNSTIISLFSTVTSFSTIFVKNSKIYSLIAFSTFFDYINIEDSWIISPIPFDDNYFLNILNIILILLIIIIFFLVKKIKKN
ncbi:MAG: S8 family serine peptidase [Euryarchaeota archaeon]|nr:S8 family serine peptidase [Euryarchaeota archaeon]